MSRLEDQVDVAVTDSPLMLSTIYNCSSRLGENFNKMVIEVAKSYNCLSYYLPMLSSAKYENAGRVHVKTQSEIISLRIVEMLKANDVKYKQIGHDEENYISIVNDIIDKLKQGYMA